MKFIIKYILVLLFMAAAQTSFTQLLLLDEKKSEYRIIIPSAPTPEEVKAAVALQVYFENISGFTLPIMNDSQPQTGREIAIGNCNRLKNNKIKVKFGDKEEDGFQIITRDESLFITGGSPAGTLNGVYTFLEEYLGCRYYSADAVFIPSKERIELPGINDRQVPFFNFRELLFPGRYDSAYLAWHKLHSHHDGSWGMWVHTFDDLVPPKTYFKEHPEYFTEINGKRIIDGQLCLSNPEVFEVLTANLRRKIEGKPEARYWSVSQNDNFLACQCSECKKIAAEYGGESGLMIWFVNRVADLFPDKVISTLAYQYTRQAPKHIRPHPNVNIMLCTIECNRSRPIAEDNSAGSFGKDLKAWAKLTDNILIWDYVVQFRNYISPFPNLRVLQPNLEFFADNGCRLMFQQGSNQSLSEFVDLRSYIVAKLLWNPDADPEEIKKDFIYGYYGAAAPFIGEYIERLHDELENSGGDLWIYGFPYTGIKSFLRPELIPEYTGLMDNAEEAVKNDPVLLDRVLFARLPLDFAIMDISLHNVDENLSWFRLQDGQFEIREDMMNLLDTFVNRCSRLGVETLNEQAFSPEAYREQVNRFLLKNSDRHLAIGKPVELMTTYSPKYEAGGAGALTDGLRGINDYNFNWLGFEGEDLEAVIDLGEEMMISGISADFLQNHRSWIFLPKSFTVYISTNEDDLQKLGTIQNPTPDNQPGSFIQTFTVSGGPAKARYIRVRAESIKTCPAWHIGAGNKSWIFTDEIVVKSQESPIKVMTFNIRFDNPGDGVNWWENRRELATEKILETSPDLIGMQEVLERQLDYLSQQLPGYFSAGVGRDDGKTGGEYVPVLFKKDRFRLLDQGTFWLSATPHDTGSVGWDAALTRICTWVKLSESGSGRQLFFLNTHFDHMGDTARAESAKLILDFIKKETAGLPVILTGDFNCSPEEEPYRVLTSPGSGLTDACPAVAKESNCTEGTYQDWGREKDPPRIDFIFYSEHWNAKAYQVLKITRGDLYISDHWPVSSSVIF